MAMAGGTGTPRTGGFASTFIFIALLAGAIFGATFGQALDGRIAERRVLSILAAFFAVLIIWLVRHFLGKAYPAAFVKPRGKSIPLAVWLGVTFSSVVGGLAGHDIGQLFGVTSGALYGLISGTIAGISMSMLMVVYFHEHPEERTEF
ncbi:hypothetical protein SAZ10_24295 [Mesorhizobium sp. BAC0120]|uniref:hypothetical protein n=1 Tax=Mesorhizobium sp. BAC0120 TaxID=3090670 RepID=UPI00298BF289|nr:hypothetical protein [Mesorhizobium sp. BAC0120]MDW6024880.1 hypothetical protein [Mesorhizobium sp. BAC0120]